MAIIGQYTLNQVFVLAVDADPSTTATAAPIGSIATIDDSTNSKVWIKTTSSDTGWSLIPRLPNNTSVTTGSIFFGDSTGNIGQNNANFFWDNTNVRLGIGLTAPVSKIHVDGGTATSTGIRFTNGTTTGQTNTDGMFVGIGADAQAYVWQYEANNLVFGTSNAEKMRIDASGRVVIGGAAPQDVTGTAQYPIFQILGTSLTQMLVGQYSNNTSPPTFNLIKSRGTTIGTQGLLSSGDEFGRLQFRGSDGSAFQAGASIRAYVDGTAAAGSMPGRLSLLTTPTGSITPTERMNINSSGVVSISSNGTAFVRVIPGWSNGAGSWIDLDTTGPSGIGTGGAGFNPWIAYAAIAGQWSTDSVTGDIIYRNQSGKMLWNSDPSASKMALSAAGVLSLGTASPNASALFQVDSTTKGILVPRMTTVQRLAIATPATSLLVYDITDNGFWYHDGNNWTCLSGIYKATNNTTLNSVSATTLTNVTDMSINVYNGKTYVIEAYILFSSTATTTGIALSIGATTATGTITAFADIPVAADGTGGALQGQITAFGDVVVGTGVQATNTTYMAKISGIFTCTTSGTIYPQFRSEVPLSPVSLLPGSRWNIRES